MTKRDIDGGMAFPWANNEAVQYHWINHGMTLQDWFAGQALAGMAAKFSADEWASGDLADFAYDVAEAMVVEKIKREAKSGKS